MTDSGDGAKARSIIRLRLDEISFVRRRPEVEHEREVAIFDLLEENTFTLNGDDAHPGPYHVTVGLSCDRLMFNVHDETDTPIRQIALPIKPFRMLIKDYFIVCESYFDAIKASSPSQIEAIDMGRRALHNEGADGLRERLAADVAMDHVTARRFFTLLCVLQMRG
ncbi:MAG: UPF0262 family protein [Alphaproteobacteria bacterium]|nr:UPF0262 family protein [Alphaproteobacteria bacterium]